MNRCHIEYSEQIKYMLDTKVLGKQQNKTRQELSFQNTLVELVVFHTEFITACLGASCLCALSS